MTAAEILDETWRAVPETVPTARHAVRNYLAAAETSDPPSSDVALAVSEAVTNVVQHAYARDDEPGSVRVRVEIHEDEVEVMVQDAGSGMVPRPDSPGLGLGLSIMQRMAAEISFVGPPQRAAGTEVRLRFNRG